MNKKCLIGVLGILIVIAIILLVINWQKKSDFEYMKPINLEKLDEETKIAITDKIGLGSTGLIKQDNKYYIVITTGTPCISPIEYSVDTFNQDVEVERYLTESQPYRHITWWFGEPDGKRTIRYVVLEVKHPDWEVEQRHIKTIPAETTIIDGVVRHMDDNTLKVWCEDFGIIPAVTQDSLIGDYYISSIEDGTYSLKIQLVDNKLVVSEIEPINSLIISGEVINTIGVYDTIKLSNGDELSVKNRHYKLDGKVKVLIDNKFEVLELLS